MALGVTQMKCMILGSNKFHMTCEQWCSGGYERLDASRHLFFLSCHRLDVSRHFLANFLVISDYIRLLNSTDCFGGKDFALDPNNSLQTLSKLFPFALSLGTLHSSVYRTYMGCISPMSPVKKSLGTSKYTTASLPVNCLPYSKSELSFLLSMLHNTMTMV